MSILLFFYKKTVKRTKNLRKLTLFISDTLVILITMKKEKNLKQILRFIPMLAVMVIIFLFSCKEGDDSASQSGLILTAIKNLVEEVTKRGMSDAAVSTLHHIIRKTAHFTEYAVLGCTVMYAVWNKWKSHRVPLILPEVIAALYATTDEIHQYFVPGRYGTWSDVLIDSCGAFTGIFIWYLIDRKRSRSKTIPKENV